MVFLFSSNSFINDVATVDYKSNKKPSFPFILTGDFYLEYDGQTFKTSSNFFIDKLIFLGKANKD